MRDTDERGISLEIGDLLDQKYRLVRLLGSGGWGSVYEGENTRTLHRVAIKILHPQMVGRGDMVARFEREAQAAGKIGSEHIIEVYDLGELPTGQRYMVMEYLEGVDLAERLKAHGRIEAAVLAPIMVQVLEGLAAAHDAGILHRDLKPENLFLLQTKQGEDFVKILDFGISKFSSSTPDSMTRTGTVMGSPCYMSPEQARGIKDLDTRSDLFSLGVVLFECVTGQLPFQGDTFNELMFKIALEDVRDPLLVCPELDPDFGAIVRRALARDPDARYPTAVAFQEALLEWMTRKGIVSQEVVLRKRGRGTPSGKGSARVRIDRDGSHEEMSVTVAAPSSPIVGAGFSGSPQGLSVTTAGGGVPARRAVLVAVPLALIIVAIVAIFAFRAPRGERVVAGPPPPTVSAPPPPSASVVVAPTPPPSASSVESASAAHAETTPPTTPRPKGGHGATVTTARPSASTAPAASDQPAPSATTAAGTNTIEGRRIHTGL